MSKTFILTLIGMGLVYWCHAQSLSPSVIASGGEVSQGEKIQLEWTLGEPAVQSLLTSSGIMTEGFHQPVLKVEALSEPHESPEVTVVPSQNGLDITIAPNPVESLLSIRIESDLEQQGVIYLTDLSGQQLQRLEASFFNENLEWDLSQFPSGLYLLTFYDKEGALLKTFKVTKVR